MLLRHGHVRLVSRHRRSVHRHRGDRMRGGPGGSGAAPLDYIERAQIVP
jgi:hypothetical protein